MASLPYLDVPMAEKTSLRDKTKLLLNSRPRSLTYSQIAIDTGLTLDFLTDFASGSRPNASANKVQTLFEYLSGTEIV